MPILEQKNGATPTRPRSRGGGLLDYGGAGMDVERNRRYNQWDGKRESFAVNLLTYIPFMIIVSPLLTLIYLGKGAEWLAMKGQDARADIHRWYFRAIVDKRAR
jgi:hypothetical protein